MHAVSEFLSALHMHVSDVVHNVRHEAVASFDVHSTAGGLFGAACDVVSAGRARCRSYLA